MDSSSYANDGKRICSLIVFAFKCYWPNRLYSWPKAKLKLLLESYIERFDAHIFNSIRQLKLLVIVICILLITSFRWHNYTTYRLNKQYYSLYLTLKSLSLLFFIFVYYKTNSMLHIAPSISRIRDGCLLIVNVWSVVVTTKFRNGSDIKRQSVVQNCLSL